MSGLKRLGEEVAKSQREIERGFRQQAARARFVASGARPARARPSRTAIVAALTLAGAGVAAVVVVAGARGRALTFAVAGAVGREGQPITASGEGPVSIAFSDGTHLALAARTQARVLEGDAAGARVVIDRGRMSAEVRHRDADTRWRIDAGPFQVLVVGTRFDVGWDPHRGRFELDLQEGRVSVTGPGIAGTRTVSTGERLALDAGLVPAAQSPSGPSPPTAAASPRLEPEAEVAPAARLPRRPQEVDQPPVQPSPWSALAREGRFQEAWASLDAGTFDAVLEAAAPSDLALAADVARFSGHASRAAAALHALRRRFPSAPESADVSFLLARLASDQQHDEGEAILWLTRYLHERPGGTFEAEAAGRLVECQRAIGDQAAARAAAERYLAQFPGGSYASLARRVLDGP